MQLETKLKRLAARLPARQQALDFLGDDVWQTLSGNSRQACRQAIANVLLQVLQDESHNESANHAEEEDQDE